MPKVDFTPAADGFHFANRFVNTIVHLPVYGDITSYGRCGGMTYAALDYYTSHLPVPPAKEADFANTGGAPADGTPLADYIYRRQIDSFLTLSAIKFITWSISTDEPTPLLRGVTRWTKEDEFSKLRAAILAGNPAPLGLIVATDLTGLAHNHQVIAYGFDGDATTSDLLIYIYDNNYPDQEVVLKSGLNSPHFQESTGEIWRGFFVQDYSAHKPPELPAVVAAPRALAMAAAVAPVSVAPTSVGLAPKRASRPRHMTVTFDRATINDRNHSQSVHELALVLSVNDQHLRWPARNARNSRAGRSYLIGKSMTVDIDPADNLSLSVMAVHSALGEVIQSDNDQPVDVASASFGALEKWGRGRHQAVCGQPDHGITVEYTITSGRQ